MDDTNTTAISFNRTHQYGTLFLLKYQCKARLNGLIKLLLLINDRIWVAHTL